MRALLLGGTGAMGVHVSDELACMGWQVVVTSRKPRESTRPEVSFLQGDAHQEAFLDDALAGGFDVAVDFMIRPAQEFEQVCGRFLSKVGRYVFLSSYRVYADSPVIVEDSPRLLDVVDDPKYLATDEYALAKARCENLLYASGKDNWTIVRPAVTYDGSAGRLQLGVMESATWLWRATNGIPVPMPQAMLGKQATMSWGGDVARMIARLCIAESAAGEAYTVSTAEHLSWAEVAAIYAEVVPLQMVPCGLEEFEHFHGGVYQIRYDRMFDRVVDNAKVLAATGMAQSELTGMREGLQRELRLYLESREPGRGGVGEQARMDRLVGGCPSCGPLVRDNVGPVGLAKYLVRRLLG